MTKYAVLFLNDQWYVIEWEESKNCFCVKYGPFNNEGDAYDSVPVSFHTTYEEVE